jgi:uncharacterized membrane protein YccC
MLSTKFSWPWTTALERFIEVALGIIVALIVAKTLWPSHARQQLRKDMQQAFIALSNLFRAIVERYRHNQMQSVDGLMSEVRDRMLRLHDLRQQAAYEPDEVQLSDEMIGATVAHLRLVRQSIDGLELSTRGGLNSSLQDDLEPELEQLLNQISITFEQLTNKLLLLNKTFDPEPLMQSSEALNKKISSLAIPKVSPDNQFADLHFYSFLASLRSLAVELSLTGQQLINGQ